MIVFISTYLSHHQLPFCLQMDRLTEHQFLYIACEKISEERLKLGYENLNEAYPFVLRAYENDEASKKAAQLCETCDVLLIGSAPERFFLDRLRSKKLTFRISERPFKEPFTVKNYFRRAVGMLRHQRRYQNSDYYLLACSAYAAADYARFGCFRGRAYRWGYFPEVKQYQDADAPSENKEAGSILWVARMIDCKRPEFALRLASRLKSDGYRFSMKMVGDGPLMKELQTRVEKEGLSDRVTFTGVLPPAQVRQEMENSQIFLFTSDRREGWGAVVNEAMNSGCALVANRAAGSVPFLIQNGRNGFSYEDEAFDTAYQALCRLLNDPHECQQLGRSAYQTLAADWNAEQAASRLLEVIIHAKKGEPFFYETGICSAAERLKD